MQKEEIYQRMNELEKEVIQLQEKYWFSYSNIDTWEFWLMLGMFIVPLIVFLWKVDKKRIFFIMFYGMNIHVWFTYIDVFGVRRDYWGYPHSLTPYYTFGVTFDVSLVPVAFMLCYQWVINRQKNFYLYSIGLAAIFSFIFKPIMVALDLFRMHNGMNYFYLFLLYCVVILFSKLITEFFVRFKEKRILGEN